MQNNSFETWSSSQSSQAESDSHLKANPRNCLCEVFVPSCFVNDFTSLLTNDNIDPKFLGIVQFR